MTQMTVHGTVPEWTTADRLRKAREHAGLEQAQLAADLGVSRNTVGNYEGGRVSPRRPVLVAWALRTGVPLWWLQGTGPDDDGLPRLDSNQQPSGYTSPQVRRLHVVETTEPTQATRPAA